MTNAKQFSFFNRFITESSSNWPRKTDTCCWNCCHSFDTTPVCIPKKYDETTNLFHVYGIFCSWNCAKTHLEDEYHSIASEQFMWMCIMAKDVFGCDIYSTLVSAPPRFCLTMFGGEMTIEQYREKSLTTVCEILEPPMISHFMMLRQSHVGDHGYEGSMGDGNPVISGIRRPHIDQTQIGTIDGAREEEDPPSVGISEEGSAYLQFIRKKENERKNPEPPASTSQTIAFSKNGTLMEFIRPA